MDDYHSQHPSHPQVLRACQVAVRSAANTPMLSIKHEFVNPAHFIHNYPHSNQQQYEQQWEHNILNEMVKEMEASRLKSDPRALRYGEYQQNKQGHSRPKNLNRSKKKELSRYKPYAVKMKMPNNMHQARPKVKQKQSTTANSDSKNRSENTLRPQRQFILSKGQDIFRVNVRDIAMLNIFQSSGVNIFKKKPKGSNHNIRKRSVKTSQKKKQQQGQVKESINKYLKTSTSPKLAKKFVMSIEQSTFQNHEHVQHNDKRKEQSSVNKKMLTKSIKSPQKLTENEQRAAITRTRQFTMKVELDENHKFLQKMEKAIHFKKKDSKFQSPPKQIKKERSLEPMDKNTTKSNMNYDGSNSKPFVKAIYASKDIIRNKSNILKQSVSKDLQVLRRQGGHHKVFAFNSQDQYVRRILLGAGWIQNHDERSQFYNFKWVFKPDSIDYLNLKPNQIVNHVRNSHQLTAKNYLNKNLKSHTASWKSLNQIYPKSYDLGRASQKQDFYEEYKKQVMMILLQNLYGYFIQLRTAYVQELTLFYRSILEQDGTYNQQSKSESYLRNKDFRKIDLQDYKHYDKEFVVHMSLFVISLKYWRSIRKQQDLSLDQQLHFLAFKQKQFDNNFHHLERYSKMNLPYSSQLQPYFQAEYFATPSQTAIEKFVKEYVYFENQLRREWKIFGKGNTWIVKPCSASRGNGIYLTNDCSQVLTDNRGIQSKIVQRYIQRPLILKSGLVSNKKFDLRQWVLLKSVEPLQIYMFSHCYVRICSDEFNMNNISNLKAHLTNYSFNKKHYKRASESVIDQDTFQEMLLQQRNINFVEFVRPKVKSIIINSIKSTQHLISDCNQRCFSLLGYDILLDDDCEPWLLEINMSPACQERTQWLKSYLQSMGKQLLQIIMPDYLSSLVSPTKKNQSSLEYKESLQLKKMKTQVSQNNFEPNSYINAIFSLDNSDPITQGAVQANKSEASQQWKEQRIYSEGQLGQNQEDKEGFEEIQLQIQEDQNKEADDRFNDNSKERVNTEKFNHLELYLQEQEVRNKSMSLQKQKEQSALLLKQQSIPNFTHHQSSLSAQMRSGSELSWQKILHEEYFTLKKDVDPPCQVTAFKITPQKVRQIDYYLDYLLIEKTNIEKKCINLQQCIRKFLLSKKQKTKLLNESISLKINVAKLMKVDSEREAKSSLESHNLSIRELNSVRQVIERPITARINSASSKYRNEASFRDRIRSIVSKAAARMNGERQEEGVIKDKLLREQVREYVCKSQDPVDPCQVREQLSKQQIYIQQAQLHEANQQLVE